MMHLWWHIWTSIIALSTMSQAIQRMPTIFFGHGSPMNAIEENSATQGWRDIVSSFPKPTAILSISAHWYVNGVRVTAMKSPETIHDFGGFPKALFDAQYPAPGNPRLAERIKNLLQPLNVTLDNSWGLDHGTWSVLIKAYPNADIPVLQLSIDKRQPPNFHYELGRKLIQLRDEGVLIMGSGNIIHNFGMIDWAPGPPQEWAVRFTNRVKDALANSRFSELINYLDMEQGIDAAPTPDHWLPLLYIIGCKREDDTISTANDIIQLGSLSMLCVIVN
ncbi:unnamed protein product [Blepharisma stoltei]|uniref:Extradiol ring-cleavage dioxygenase class III enzyme subunit B domain-containing protein n=1 Tax=Blepharisma stoltei TaxID=1481888 RepID=A0AAU9J8C8_9CILI|nr:unnamed protein product [Blepharisma stoltei]